MSTPRDPDSHTDAQAQNLTETAVLRARRADLHVTNSFRRELTKLVTRGMTRAHGDSNAVRRATDTLVDASIRIAQEAADPELEPDHLRAAKVSLCPLWPIC